MVDLRFVKVYGTRIFMFFFRHISIHIDNLIALVIRIDTKLYLDAHNNNNRFIIHILYEYLTIQFNTYGNKQHLILLIKKKKFLKN